MTIITTGTNEMVGQIHDRMPVILEPSEEEQWLEGADPEEPRSLFDPYPEEVMDAYEISTKVNSSDYDSPDVIESLGHDPAGLGSSTKRSVLKLVTGVLLHYSDIYKWGS